MKGKVLPNLEIDPTGFFESNIYDFGTLEPEVLEPEIADTDMEPSREMLLIIGTIVDTGSEAGAAKGKRKAPKFRLLDLPTEVIKMVINHVHYWEDFVELTNSIPFAEDPLTNRQKAAMSTFTYYWPLSYLVMVGLDLRRLAEETDAGQSDLESALCEGPHSRSLLKIANAKFPILTQMVWDFYYIVHETLLPLEQRLKKENILPLGLEPHSCVERVFTYALHKPAYGDLMRPLLVFWLYCDFFERSIVPQVLPKGHDVHPLAYLLKTQMEFLSKEDEEVQLDLHNLSRSFLWVDRSKDVFIGQFNFDDVRKRRTAIRTLCNRGIDTLRLFASDVQFCRLGDNGFESDLPPRERQVLLTELENASNVTFSHSVRSWNDRSSTMSITRAMDRDRMNEWIRVREERQRAWQEDRERLEAIKRREAKERKEEREMQWRVKWDKQVARQRQIEMFSKAWSPTGVVHS